MRYKILQFLSLNLIFFSSHASHADYHLTIRNLPSNTNNTKSHLIKNHVSISCYNNSRSYRYQSKRAVTQYLKNQFKYWDTEQFAYYFSQFEDKGLRTYFLYGNKNFCTYLKTLPEYKDHIRKLYKKFQCKKHRKKVLKETNFSEKYFVHTICRMYQEIEHEEKIAKQKKQEELKRQEQLKFNQLKHQKLKIQKVFEQGSDQRAQLLEEYNTKPKQITLDLKQNKYIIERRKKALQNAHYNAFIERRHKLDTKSKVWLTENNIDAAQFEYCYGNQIQQQLHSEYVSIINEASEMRVATDAEIMEIMNLVASMSAKGLEQTHNGHIEQGTTLANACWTFLDYGKAVTKGLIQGAVLDQIDMVMHPVQTIKNVGHLLSNVGYYLGKVAYEYGHLSYLTFTDPEAAHKKVEAWGENISVLANALYDKYQEMSGPELAQESTRFISGALFGRKTMGLMCNVFKKVPGKIARKAAEVFRKLQEEERVHITPDGSKIKLQNTSFMDKAREIGGKSKLKNINKKTKEAIKHSKATTKIGKYGKYEDAAYHTKIGNKLKSKAPIDGQHALNNSLRIKDTSPWRIALSNNEFVVLSDTSPGVFHGHVRTWNELTADMQKVLRKAGLVTKKGKIIKQ